MLSQMPRKVAVLSYLEGSCIVNNTRLESRESNLYIGSSIFNNDIILSGDNSECHITYDNQLTAIIINESSKVDLIEDNFSRTIKLDYGQIFIESSKNDIKTYVSTHNNEIYINNNKLWIESSISLDDKIFPINSDIDIFLIGLSSIFSSRITVFISKAALCPFCSLKIINF